MSHQLFHNDVIKWCREYDGPKFHAIFCDPPYHLTSITKRFGANGSAPAKFGKDGAFQRASAGFMNQTWDGGNIAFDPDTWAVLGEHLYPGAFGLAYASSRGWHRMACAIEDAGFIIFPSIFGWVNLQPFPKATRLDKAIDKMAGVESGKGGWQDDPKEIVPSSPLALAFSGYRYGGQVLKNSLEPLICFQKPYEGRPIDCIVKTGAGALNIDGGRIATGDTTGWGGHPSQGYSSGLDSTEENGRPTNGRWPANFYLRHSEFCTADNCVEDCPVRLFDEQAGESTSTGGTNPNPTSIGGNGIYGGGKEWAYQHYGDSGPASRMFHQSTWVYEVAEQLANADPVRYEPKSSSTEREAGLDSLETQTRHRVNAGGLENEPRFAPTQVKNHHPTVKPISGNKYFATLLLPPAEYIPRRILVPFAGVGSEMIGAILAGWDEVIGIEAEANYIQIAEVRLKWWSQWPGWGQSDVDTILQASGQNGQQLSFLG